MFQNRFVTIVRFQKSISHSSSPDQELADRYRDTGNIELLGHLFERYMELVYGVCLKYLSDPALAQDAVMNIFEELVQKLQRHEVTNFKSWLYSLTKNHCLMQLRSQKNKTFVSMDIELMQSHEDLHLNGIFDKEKTFETLNKCLESLSVEQKAAVEMFYLEEKSYKEISSITNNDWPKVKSLIQNGRRNLKICMDRREDA